jgi:GntR family transcriptional regulator
MNILLNLTDLSDEPLQSQLIRQIRAHILIGDLKPEESLPSIRSMARDQHVSVITVQRAYEALMREGLIRSRRGKGFFVSMISGNNKKKLSLKRLDENIRAPIKTALDEGLDTSEIREIVETILDKEQNRG